MKKENQRYIRELAFISTVGLSLAFSIFIGLAIGLYLDRRWDTAPWMTIIFIVLGIVAGFRNVGLVLKRVRKL